MVVIRTTLLDLATLMIKVSKGNVTRTRMEIPVTRTTYSGLCRFARTERRIESLLVRGADRLYSHLRLHSLGTATEEAMAVPVVKVQ